MFTALTLQALMVLVPAPREKDTADKGPGFLGIAYEDDGDGLLITEVFDKSPAKKSGLQVGDRLIKFDGTKPASLDAFARQVVRIRPGTECEAEVVRNGEKKTLKVKVGVRPEDFALPLPLPGGPPPDITPPPPAP
jgi:S1-C subfamily serine protease